MSPKNDNPKAENDDMSVDISHDDSPPATAPPLMNVDMPTPAPAAPVVETVEVSPVEEPRPVAAEIPTIYEDIHEHEGRRWPMLLMYFALALLVTILIVLAGRFVYHKLHKTTKAPAKPAPVTVTPTETPAVPNQNPSTPSTSTSTSTNSSTTANGQLPNNGPGDVVAIFVGTALLVGGLHYIYQLRRSA